MMRRRHVALWLIAASTLAACNCGSGPVTQRSQAQAECKAPKKLDSVGLCVECTLNADCPPGQQCDLINGNCEAIPPVPDGGPVLPTCSVGAVRCAIDGHAVQNCEAGATGNGWVDVTQCTGGETCNPMTLTCAICVPGETVCLPDGGGKVLSTCSPDGTEYQPQVCNDPDAGQSGFTCSTVVPPQASTDGGPPLPGLATCELCPPNSAVCVTSADAGIGLDICDSTGTVLDYHPCYPTNVCISDGGASYCEPYICLPGQGRCELDDGGFPAPYTSPARQACNGNGTAFVDSPCQPTDAGTPTLCGPTQGDQGACLTPCQQAESSDSYFGCDYWGTLLSNSQLASNYTGDSSNQSPGTTASDFAFVVSNTNPSVTANVTVSMVGLPSVTATVAPNSVQPVYLPWRPICGSGMADFGYHLVSDLPVTVYQFNPLHSFLQVNASGTNSPACNTDSDCDPSCFPGDPTCATPCLNNVCVVYSYTNDASLLLPTHLLGTSYVVASYNQITEGNFGNASDQPLAGEFAIVATANNTNVTVAFSGATASTSQNASANGGECDLTQGNVSAQSAQTIVQFPLSQGQVLQFWAASVGVPQCQMSLNGDTVCLYPNDLTGTVVTSIPGTGGSGDGGTNSPAQPIAVFGGADCTYVPYNQVACDHIEEEMFPFNTWGKEYVGVKTAQYTGATYAYPDFFRLISACGPASCPNGATATFTPEIPFQDAQGNPLITYSAGPSANWCSNNAQGQTVCTLPPLMSGQTAPWVGFQSASSFYVTSDHPISVAQYLVSETEAGDMTIEGDPDILLVPPVEQWRDTYAVLAPNTYLDNYLDMVAHGLGDGGDNPSASILVDGSATPSSEWNNIPGTPFWAANHKVCGRTAPGLADGGIACTGSHTIDSTIPVGVTISGYDSYVTYSYTGGLDLQTINAIKPGG